MQVSSFSLKTVLLVLGISILTYFYQSAYAQASLNDIQDNPYRESIEFLYNNNIVTGHPGGNFAPDISINKAEFMVLLVRSYGLNIAEEGEGCFLDVLQGEWYTKYICLAKEMGVARGNPDGTFSPEKPVSLAEILALTFRMYDYPVDDSLEGPWYENYIQFAKQNEMFQDSSYDPGRWIRRDEAAFLTHQVYLEKKEPLPLNTEDIMVPSKETEENKESEEENQPETSSLPNPFTVYYSSGGGRGGGGGANPVPVPVPELPTAQELAIEKIVAYAENGLIPPTLQDYTDAGVIGVDISNLDQANAAIEALSGEDVDTLAGIQAVIDTLNHAPVATDQAVVVDEDTVNNNITLSGTDEDDDPLTYSIVTQPDHGILGGTAPDITYTPNADYFGSDSFTFIVNDGSVDSEPATVSITINDVAEPVADNTVLMFVAYNGTWWAEYKVAYEGLLALGYNVEVRSSSPGVALTYGDTVDNTTNGGVAPSTYDQFTTLFEDNFGVPWNPDWNTLEDISLDGQIQDVVSMDDYVALVIPGGYGSQSYRYDGTYADLLPSAELLALGHHVIPDPELHIESAANVQSAAEKLNELIAEAVSLGKPVMTVCHAAPLSAFARVPGSVGGFDGLGISLLDGKYATGFPLLANIGGAVGDVAEMYNNLNVTFLIEEAVVVDGPDNDVFDGNGKDTLVTVLNWYPEHVAYGTRTLANILESYPSIEQRQQTFNVLVFGGNEPSHYAGYPPANEVDIVNLLNLASDYDITATSTDDEAVLTATLDNYDTLVYFQHNEIDLATQNVIKQYVDDGGGAVFIHHGIYNHNGGNDILVEMVGGQLPETANLIDTDIYFDELVANAMVNVNYGHFVSSFDVFPNSPIADPSIPVTVPYQSFDGHYPNANLDQNGGYFSFDIPAPDELYPASEFMPGVIFGRGLNQINRLFSSNTFIGNGLPNDGSYDTWGWTKLFSEDDPDTVGRIVYLQPGETNGITFSTPLYQQVIRNAIIWAASQ